MIKKTSKFTLFLLLISCGIAKQRIEIPDYLVVPNGKESVGNKSLNAFIFENNQKNIPFQEFITTKFNTNNYLERELWIKIQEEKYKLLFYNNDEFEKYFGASNFTVINQETDANKTNNQPNFIAISVINDRNEDCLAENVLSKTKITLYLKKLKDEYLQKR